MQGSKCLVCNGGDLHHILLPVANFIAELNDTSAVLFAYQD